MCCSCPAVDLAPRVWVAAKAIASSISTRIHFCVMSYKRCSAWTWNRNYLFLQHRNPAALNEVQYISTRLQREAFQESRKWCWLFSSSCFVVLFSSDLAWVWALTTTRVATFVFIYRSNLSSFANLQTYQAKLFLWVNLKMAMVIYSVCAGVHDLSSDLSFLLCK